MQLPEETDRKANANLRMALIAVANSWHLFLSLPEQAVLRARLLRGSHGGADEVGDGNAMDEGKPYPSWQETVGWARWLLLTRQKQSVVDVELQGRTKTRWSAG